MISIKTDMLIDLKRPFKNDLIRYIDYYINDIKEIESFLIN